MRLSHESAPYLLGWHAKKECGPPHAHEMSAVPFSRASQTIPWKGIFGRAGAAAGLLCVALSPHSQAQSVPSWPDLRLTTCPPISAPKTGYQRTWKLGQTEQSDFEAISKAQDRKEMGTLLIAFAKKYPDSDYRNLALFLAIGAGIYSKDVNLQVEAATIIAQSSQGEAASLLAAFVTLDGSLAGYVLSSDPERERKLADLELWTRCGRQALEALKIQEAAQPKSIEAIRKDSESILARTSGFIALQRHDYDLARRNLETAAEINPQDAMTYLLLSSVEFGDEKQNANAGLFYLARTAELAPQLPSLSELLKQSYVAMHGSEDGLARLRVIAHSNPTIPSGVSIFPKTKKPHRAGTALAAAAIVGLLVYGAVEHPNFMIALGQSIGGTQPSDLSGSSKLMLFGGADHKTYLGCLSCSENATDSVSNKYRQNGSPYSQTSIWNHFSQFGSAFSAYGVCNLHASDPPVIVNQEGAYYGRLTLNRFHPQIGLGTRLIPWLRSAVCGD